VFLVSRGLLVKFQYCDSNIEIFSIAPPLVITLNPFASIFEIGSWLLFCIASHTVIAFPTIATAIVVALLRS
jgi:hypothetical protein